jgi:opacity protein-like surface antigen
LSVGHRDGPKVPAEGKLTTGNDTEAPVADLRGPPPALFTRSVTFRIIGLLFAALLTATAQTSTYSQWELGGDFGYGIYRNGTIFSPAGNATAGIRNRFVAGAYLAEDLYDHFSGELHYLYQDGHPFLSTNSVSKDMQGQSHTITYDALFHFKPRDSKLRPFVAAGAGVKGYTVVGPPPVPQPIPAIATLNRINEWKFVASLGGGIKYRLRDHISLRVDFRDYLTQFPKRQISPAANGTARGIFQQFTPTIGVGYVF